MKDRVHRVPRVWSNNELRKFAHLFSGDIVNVSGWKDIDKQGQRYRDYFSEADSYTITNYDADKRGFQGMEGEIFLDLTKPLPSELTGRFDVVFNHTTLEHIFDASLAFHNLCEMTRDVVILVVPFLQPMHTNYGDYWRFSPQAVVEMFNREGLEVAYLNFNDHYRSSVYVFAIGLKRPDSWKGVLPFTSRLRDESRKFLKEPYAGCNAIHRNWREVVFSRFPKLASIWLR